MIVLCFEKYEIPQNVGDAKDIMIDYLEDAKNEKLPKEIKLVETQAEDIILEGIPKDIDINNEEAPGPAEPKSLQISEPVESNISREKTPQYQVVYSLDKIFPKLEKYIIETPLSINCFLEYVQEKNGVIAHPYNDVSEIDS